jgi:hypothetical protein
VRIDGARTSAGVASLGGAPLGDRCAVRRASERGDVWNVGASSTASSTLCAVARAAAATLARSSIPRVRHSATPPSTQPLTLVTSVAMRIGSSHRDDKARDQFLMMMTSISP